MARPQKRKTPPAQAQLPVLTKDGKVSQRGKWSRGSAEDRFWAKVEKEPGENGCWIWTGTPRGDYGHGGFYFRGHNVFAHVFSWALEYAPELLELRRLVIPDEKVVRHFCHRHGCVRPDHLILGTEQENVDDREAAEHGPQGERNPAAKLNETSVRQIRQRAAAGEERAALAVAYGVTLAAIHDVVSRRSWKHLDDHAIETNGDEGSLKGNVQNGNSQEEDRS